MYCTNLELVSLLLVTPQNKNYIVPGGTHRHGNVRICFERLVKSTCPSDDCTKPATATLTPR